MPSFSLRNPYLIIVGALMTVILGATAFTRMPTDVFPDIKIPAVVVATFYQGMPPLDMEDNITFRYERFFTLGSNIDHIESRSLSGVSIIKVFFQPGTDVASAAAQMGTLAMADLGIMPPGTLPPLVLQYDVSSLPVVLVTLEGKGFDETQLEDQARYNVRNQLATVPGASIPIPFGGKFRQVMAYANSQALQARGLSLMDVVHALDTSNLILPAGDVKIGSKDYYIYSNSMIEKVPDIGQVPVKIGRGQAPVLMDDVAKVDDSAQIQYNKVLINGQPSVYVPILRQAGANTISVVDGIKDLLPKVFGLPAGMKLKTILDQSIYVRQAVASLEHEAMSGSVLASLVILIFLGSFRSTFAIFLSIPLSILAGGFGLFMNGSTINIMTLGGFALAIGRLVDDSVVVLENINRHLAEGKEPHIAAREGAEEVALPVLASTITTCVVFFPVMFLFGVAKYLFSALALAVVLSMGASYLVSMSIIPLYCARFLTTEQALAAEHGESSGIFLAFNRLYERFASGYERLLENALNHKSVVIVGVAILFVVSLAMYPRLGTELFPETDAGTFTINFRAPAGTRIEKTTDMARQIEAIIRKVIPPDQLDMVVSNIGIAPSISAIYSPNAAQDSAFMQVALKAGHRHPTEYYVAQLKQILPVQIPDARTLFSSGSIIDSVLNLGMMASIDVQFAGRSFSDLNKAAKELQEKINSLPEVSQSFIAQELDYPTLNIKVDRVRAARLGVAQQQVIQNVITALDSNLYIKPSIWIDHADNDDYFLTAQYPGAENGFDSLEVLQNIPIETVNRETGHASSLLLRDVATISPEFHPSEADHYSIQRVVDLLVAPSTSDQGGTQAKIQSEVSKMTLPAGVSVRYRGAVASMQKSFASFGFGLSLAVVLLYLVMVAQFRSFLDPLIIMFAVPMGLIGVIWTLWLTGTTLNIESFMGIIVMVGIVVSNSILLVDFANERRRQGQELRRAAIESARIRMRPILMTALATVAGLMPIAMKLGEGSEASAPLARAAVGGLIVSTGLTLFLVPCVYEFFYRRIQSEPTAPALIEN
ncbi:efflux RND transporter permease subunit [Candidatus Binatus sp.]|uniref:efflux RND transporter permease subunit n=1 Tax=Candidatus Binatus sp. TaxID=2811406 RepID=UPI003C9E835F